MSSLALFFEPIRSLMLNRLMFNVKPAPAFQILAAAKGTHECSQLTMVFPCFESASKTLMKSSMVHHNIM